MVLQKGGDGTGSSSLVCRTRRLEKKKRYNQRRAATSRFCRRTMLHHRKEVRYTRKRMHNDEIRVAGLERKA